MARAAMKKIHTNRARLSAMRRQRLRLKPNLKNPKGAVPHFGGTQEKRAKILFFHMYLKTFMAGITHSSCLQ